MADHEDRRRAVIDRPEVRAQLGVRDLACRVARILGSLDRVDVTDACAAELRIDELGRPRGRVTELRGVAAVGDHDRRSRVDLLVRNAEADAGPVGYRRAIALAAFVEAVELAEDRRVLILGLGRGVGARRDRRDRRDEERSSHRGEPRASGAPAGTLTVSRR
jgi:hypothetical protein